MVNGRDLPLLPYLVFQGEGVGGSLLGVDGLGLSVFVCIDIGEADTYLNVSGMMFLSLVFPFDEFFDGFGDSESCYLFAFLHVVSLFVI